MFDELLIQFNADDLITHFSHITPPITSMDLKSIGTDPTCPICKKLLRLAKNMAEIQEIINPTKKKLE